MKVIDTSRHGRYCFARVFTPDGKRALVTKFNAHKVSLLDVNGDKVTYSKLDLPTGQWPYNVAVAPSGQFALTADNGGAGSSDGSVDTVSVVDLELNPARITDRVVVGDGPEGLGDFAEGRCGSRGHPRRFQQQERLFSQTQRQRFGAAHRRQEGYQGRRLEVGGLPEGAAFTPDGKYLLVGNYLDQDLSILKVMARRSPTWKRFKLSGHPASIRMSTH